MKRINCLPFILAAAAALSLSCAQVLEPPAGKTAPLSAGMGRVILSVSTGADSPRTVFPREAPVFSRYALVFSRNQFDSIVVNDAGDLAGSEVDQELAAGTWTAAVTAYRLFTPASGEETEYPAARGSADLTVTAGETERATVSLAPLPVTDAAAKGIFTCRVIFPASASATLTLGNEAPIPLPSGVEFSIEKNPGYYDLIVSVTKGKLRAGVSEIAHIYAGLESRAEFEFTEDDFAATLRLTGTLALSDGLTLDSFSGEKRIAVYSNADYTGQIAKIPAEDSWIIDAPATGDTALYIEAKLSGGPEGKTYTGRKTLRITEAGARDIAIAATWLIENIADVAPYLQGAASGETADNPVMLPVAFALPDHWPALLTAIQGKGKYVVLDLSACGMTGTEFDPGTADTGESKIVSLVLPDAATSIIGGEDYSSTVFWYFKALTRVGGSNIESIGDYAFYNCDALEAAYFPKALSIGDYAFNNCGALETADFPAATSIGDWAFATTALEAADSPAATSIGDYAFYNCYVLETVNFPAATSIGDFAFSDCYVLETADFPAALSIGRYAFPECSALETVAFPEVQSIGDNAFYNCDALETVAFPEVLYIDSYAFNDCDALKAVDFPVAGSIGSYAFSDCDTLKAVDFPAAGSIGSYAFNDCDALETANFPAALSIGSYAFNKCYSLKTAALPGVVSIQANVFAATGGGPLTLTLGSAVPTLGIHLFDSVSSTKTVIVQIPPDSMAWMGKTGSFAGPSSAGTWGNGFRGRGWNSSTGAGAGSVNNNISLTISPLAAAVVITDIKDVLPYLQSADGGEIPGNPVFLPVAFEYTANWPALFNVIQTAGKYVALDLSACAMAGTTAFDITAGPGLAQIVSLVLPDVATLIPKPPVFSNFRNFLFLTSISGSNIAEAAEYSFYGCAALQMVSFPKATSIGAQAFNGCAALETVNFPEATSIGEWAFSWCDALKTADFPKAISIGERAFYDCAALKTADFPEATSIGSDAFSRCAALETVNFPNAISIGSNAFSDCDALETADFPEATYIRSEAFSGCAALKTVNFPNATSIGREAFSGCTALETVNCPKVTSISASVFASTGSAPLTLTLGSTAPGLGAKMFNGVAASKSVTVLVPSSSLSAYGGAGTYSGSANSPTSWAHGFRGCGWTGSAYSNDSTYINANVTVILKSI
jgi:hypothetical protein